MQRIELGGCIKARLRVPNGEDGENPFPAETPMTPMSKLQSLSQIDRGQTGSRSAVAMEGGDVLIHEADRSDRRMQSTVLCSADR